MMLVAVSVPVSLYILSKGESQSILNAIE